MSEKKDKKNLDQNKLEPNTDKNEAANMGDNQKNPTEEKTTEEKLKHPCIGKRHELLDNGIYILKSLIEEIPIKEIIVTNKGLRHGMINDFFGL